MINARKIKPVSFWSKEGDKLADHILLYNFHGYNFDGTDSWVSYKLGKVEQINEDQEMFYSFFEGSVPLPNTTVQEWGENDEPIFDYVIEELNLDRDE